MPVVDPNNFTKMIQKENIKELYERLEALRRFL
jgi:hypothetical protein